MLQPEPSVQSQSTDSPPSLVQAAAGFLQGVALCLWATCSILILQQNVAQAEDRCYTFCVLLHVPLQVLFKCRNRDYISLQTSGVRGREQGTARGQWHHFSSHYKGQMRIINDKQRDRAEGNGRNVEKHRKLNWILNASKDVRGKWNWGR